MIAKTLALVLASLVLAAALLTPMNSEAAFSFEGTISDWRESTAENMFGITGGWSLAAPGAGWFYGYGTTSVAYWSAAPTKLETAYTIDAADLSEDAWNEWVLDRPIREGEFVLFKNTDRYAALYVDSYLSGAAGGGIGDTFLNGLLQVNSTGLFEFNPVVVPVPGSFLLLASALAVGAGRNKKIFGLNRRRRFFY